jgi:hypothetical protein
MRISGKVVQNQSMLNKKLQISINKSLPVKTTSIRSAIKILQLWIDPRIKQ